MIQTKKHQQHISSIIAQDADMVKKSEAARKVESEGVTLQEPAANPLHSPWRYKDNQCYEKVKGWFGNYNAITIGNFSNWEACRNHLLNNRTLQDHCYFRSEQHDDRMDVAIWFDAQQQGICKCCTARWDGYSNPIHTHRGWFLTSVGSGTIYEFLPKIQEIQRAQELQAHGAYNHYSNDAITTRLTTTTAMSSPPQPQARSK